MTLQQQKELIKLISQYNQTEKETIKANLKKYMDESGYKLPYIAEQTGASLQTIYQIRKVFNSYKVDFIMALNMCNVLNIPITELLHPIYLNQPEQETKWDITSKENYIRDFNSISITEVCKRYEIVERTAQEYYRLFSLDLAKLL